MGRLMELKEQMEDYLYENVDHLTVHQMGEIADIIKDLTKSIYYCNEIKKSNVEATEAVQETAEDYHSKTKEERLKCIEEYMTEVNDDLISMIKGTTLEEKQSVVNKLTTTLQHVQNVVL